VAWLRAQLPATSSAPNPTGDSEVILGGARAKSVRRQSSAVVTAACMSLVAKPRGGPVTAQLRGDGDLLRCRNLRHLPGSAGRHHAGRALGVGEQHGPAALRGDQHLDAPPSPARSVRASISRIVSLTSTWPLCDGPFLTRLRMARFNSWAVGEVHVVEKLPAARPSPRPGSP
jgi:hypothetical protein